ncbi:MAG: ISL3 family transposase [Pseudomonadales bacterium]|nr:ISL3 family transposase [Pseudomonadales bacterium]
MSHAGTILGISELEVERVDRQADIKVYARPTTRPRCIYCRHRRVKIKATYQRTLKHTRQGNQLLTLYLKTPKYYCPQCQRYFRHRFQGVRPRYRSTEAFRLEVFEAHEGGVSQRKLSQTYDSSPATVERWYQGFLAQKRSEMSNRPCPQVLGIDEHFFTRKRGYVTTLVDLKNHKVFDVVPGRSEVSLRGYLQRLRGREKVRVIVMDLSETYRSIARRYFPNAQIVADRFHVIRLVNHHFLRAWQQHDPEGRRNRGLLSLMRRHEWHLSDDQRSNLGRYLDDYPVLAAMYEAKQELNRYLLLKALNPSAARQQMPGLLELIRQLEVSPLRSLAMTLTSWLESIVAMWRFSKTNGITEGFHTKMEMMTRRAYGFRNFENYRLRVLTHCGWDGIINRV